MVALAGQEAAFEAALCEVRQRLFMCAGFRGVSVAQGAEDPRTYLVQVRWEGVEELAAVVDQGRLVRCWTPIEPLLAAPLRMDHYLDRPGLGFVGPGVLTDLAWASD